MTRFALFFTIFLFVTFSYSLHGQTGQFYIGLEAATEGFTCKDFDKDFVRGYASPTYNPYGYYGYDRRIENITTEMYRSYAGVHVEWMSDNEKIGLLSGLRFSRLTSAVYKRTPPDFFYFLLDQSGTTTEYLRVNEVNQTSTYAGLPLEFRFFPFRRRQFNVYFKLAADFNFLLQTKSDVAFHGAEMQPHKNDVLAKFGNPGSYYSTFYTGVGLRTNKISFFYLNVDANFPPVLTPNASSLTAVNAGGGIRATIQVPF
jgi:hypothetical protein